MNESQHTLTGPLEQARGVIGRYPQHGEEFVFEFERAKKRLFHMVGVTRPLNVEFFLDGKSIRTTRLSPWVGMAMEKCDRVVETRPEVSL